MWIVSLEPIFQAVLKMAACNFKYFAVIARVRPIRTLYQAKNVYLGRHLENKSRGHYCEISFPPFPNYFVISFYFLLYVFDLFIITTVIRVIQIYNLVSMFL